MRNEIGHLDTETKRNGVDDGALRPMPDDFIEMYPRLGYEAAQDHWQAHHRTVSRWLDQAGRARMAAARLAYRDSQLTIAQREQRTRRRRRYLVGKTRTPVGKSVGKGRRSGANSLILNDELTDWGRC